LHRTVEGRTLYFDFLGACRIGDKSHDVRGLELKSSGINEFWIRSYTTFRYSSLVTEQRDTINDKTIG